MWRRRFLEELGEVVVRDPSAMREFAMKGTLPPAQFRDGMTRALLEG